MSDNSPPAPLPDREFQGQLGAVVFDMDGVLVDSEPLHLAVARDLVAPAALPLEEYQRFIGTAGLTEWISETYGIALDEARRRSTEIYLERVTREPLEPMPGARQLIESLAGYGLATAVVTMTRRSRAEAALAAAGLADLFGVIVTSADVRAGKPAPDIYLHAAAGLDLDPRACLAVEDSIHGITSARGAGMHVVQLRQATFVPPPQPEADAVIDHFEAFETAWLTGTAPGARSASGQRRPPAIH